MQSILSFKNALYGIVILGLVSTAPTFAQPRQANNTSIGGKALRQIQTILAEKTSRTPAQKKISSRLLFARDNHQFSIRKTDALNTQRVAKTSADSRVAVNLRAEVTPALLKQITAVGGTVTGAFPQYRTIHASVPLRQLESLAERAEVQMIRPADKRITKKVNTSQGDVALQADSFRAQAQVDGAGTIVCVISDGVSALAGLQASGDLPNAVTILPGQIGGSGSEGTAMLEIIHDLAPGATLGFATAGEGPAQMAQNILDLATLGCHIFVDDIGWLVVPVFQDGIIAQAVDQVVANGVLYFSAAGNSGNFNDGTSAVWEGYFKAGTIPNVIVKEDSIYAGKSAHDFGNNVVFNEITKDPSSVITLQWSEPNGAASSDYDLFLLSADKSEVIDFSTGSQDGTQDALEGIDSTGDDLGRHLVVIRFSGDDQFLRLNALRGRLQFATEGQIYGHTAANGAIAVAAINAGSNPLAGGTNVSVASYSADGPRRIFFNADGSPNNEIRQKPDLTAADGVSTATPGFNPFYGTSAAAPHVAGIAALLRQALMERNQYSVALASDLLKQSTLDIEAIGVDRDSGHGIVNGIKLLNRLLPKPGNIVSDSFEVITVE